MRHLAKMFRAKIVLACVALAYAKAPQLQERIVGGQATTIEQYPYQVSLQQDGSHTCGGALVAPNAVLTAAHCGNSINGMTVRSGTTTRESGGTVSAVLEIRIHPKYNSVTTDYDVAVWRLNQSLASTPATQTIPFVTPAEDPAVGSYGTMTGWGSLFFLGPSPSNLQVVQIPKVSQSQTSCQLANLPSAVTSRMSCYGYLLGGKDTCQGDSGGPVVHGGKVAAVVSSGIACAQPLIPGIYTNLANPEVNEHIVNCINSFQI